MSAGQAVAKVLASPYFAQSDLGIRLNDRSKGFLYGAVDGVEVKDTVFLSVHYVS